MAGIDVFVQAFERTKGFHELKQAMAQNELPAAVFDMGEGARSMLAAVLTQHARAVIVAPSDVRAGQLSRDLRGLGIPAVHFPAREQTFYHLAAESRELTQRRIGVLGQALQSDAPMVICAPVDALLQPLLAPNFFKESLVSVRVGQELPMEELARLFAQAGYVREELVESKGQFAIRGGILDVYPVQLQSAVRVEFFGDEVDTIREMDPLTQRSAAQLESFSLFPATEALCSPEAMQEAALQLKKELGDKTQAKATPQSAMPWLTWEDDDDEEEGEAPPPQMDQKLYLAAEKLEQGVSFDGIEAFLPYLGQLHSALDYVLPELILLDEPGRVRERADEVSEGFLRELLAAVDRGEALRSQEKGVYTFEQLAEQLLRTPTVLMGNLQVAVPDMRIKALIHITARQAPGSLSNQNVLAEQLGLYSKEGQQLVLFTGGAARAERMKASLQRHQFLVAQTDLALAPGHILVRGEAFTHGFELPEARLVVLGDADLYGAARRNAPKRRKDGQKIAAFTDLKVGDYVVHENHGVGVYLGTERITVQGSTRDYLNIQYGGSDKLYIPTDQLDRVQKYIGIKDSPPRLNKLGGGEWDRAKQRVKASLMEMAKELIELYAKRQTLAGHAFAPDNPWQREFEDAFPYEETPDQLQCVLEIKRDMEKPIVMDRLLCGDVGYGKTEVALRAAFKAVMDSKQVAMLVPTTILAQQHYESFRKRFADFPVRVEMLSRFRTAAEQRAIIEKVKLGDVDILIGTHRLIGKDVGFKDLGLLIVDEEQRFGVKHKESLKQMKESVDVLTLSATPIPRTLHMSMVGVRDMSLLETPPEERFPVQTYVLEYSDALLRDAVQREMMRGGQVYILYNRVRSIERFHQHVQSLVPEARIAVGHGQMRETELEDVMLGFNEGNSDVLICSTIIESGLDVQNANTLIVMDADRFGLSQLYQLRGRVGRSNRLAYCYMTVRPNKALSEQAEKRLTAIREFTEFGSGFKIAMRDLEIRGAGNILGAQQHGHMSEVGYDLYVKMMEETVKELKGQLEPNAGVEAKVEIHVDAYLPQDFVAGDVMRMDVYKRIATIKSREDFSEVLEELIDRFGDVPREAEHLLWIALLKANLEYIGLDAAFMRGNQLVMRFSPFASVDPAALMNGLQAVSGKLSIQNAQPPLLVMHETGTPEALMEKAVEHLERLREGMTQ